MVSDSKKAGKGKKGLGRGLSALMADTSEAQAAAPGRGTRSVDITKLHPSSSQPRKSFDPEQLKELAASIEQHGMIQPIVVRPHRDKSGQYEIVAGERRWRAAQLARLHDVPVVVHSYTDEETLAAALIENIQRADLNPVEEALAYERLTDTFGESQEDVAKLVGKSRAHVANTMRLLALPKPVQQMLVDGQLSAGHARALIGADDALALAKQVIAKGLSVRATEALAGQKPNAKSGGKKVGGKDANIRAVEQQLVEALGLRVDLRHGPKGGQLTIQYRDLEQLDDVIARLTRKT